MKNDREGNRQGKCLSPPRRDASLLWARIFTGGRVFRSLCYARGNNNALNNVESGLLGDKIRIRNNEAIRPRAVVFFPRATRGERKSKIMFLTYCDSEEK